MAASVGTSHLPAQAASRDTVCLVFGVDDVEASWLAVTSAGDYGVVPPTDHPDWGIRTAHVRDPDGTLIELNTPLG
jgi:predicted enzyme related to lactoylglutathione lyase